MPSRHPELILFREVETCAITLSLGIHHRNSKIRSFIPHAARNGVPWSAHVRFTGARPPLLWIAFFGIIAAALITVGQPSKYQSQASIQIQGVNENYLNLRDIYPTAAPSADNAVYVQTQAEILQQDALIEQVVRKLHLEERPEYRSSSSLWERFRRTVDAPSMPVSAVQTRSRK